MIFVDISVTKPCIFPRSHTRTRSLLRRSPVRRSIFQALATAAVVLAFGLAPAAAQTGQTFGEIDGKVTDAHGGILPGVTVSMSGPAVMGIQTAVTNERGVYRFPAVGTGTYQLKFELT